MLSIGTGMSLATFHGHHQQGLLSMSHTFMQCNDLATGLKLTNSNIPNCQCPVTITGTTVLVPVSYAGIQCNAKTVKQRLTDRINAKHTLHIPMPYHRQVNTCHMCSTQVRNIV